MARFVFATHAAGAHIAPLIPVAQRLVQERHEVTWYTGEGYRERVERAGLAFAGPVRGRFLDFERLEVEHPEIVGMTEDKPERCARVGWSGVGLNLRSHSPSPRRIRSAVRRVLADPRHRQAAERISVEQAEYDGVSTAASLLEQLAATRTAVTRVEVDQL